MSHMEQTVLSIASETVTALPPTASCSAAISASPSMTPSSSNQSSQPSIKCHRLVAWGDVCVYSSSLCWSGAQFMIVRDGDAKTLYESKSDSVSHFPQMHHQYGTCVAARKRLAQAGRGSQAVPTAALCIRRHDDTLVLCVHRTSRSYTHIIFACSLRSLQVIMYCHTA